MRISLKPGDAAVVFRGSSMEIVLSKQGVDEDAFNTNMRVVLCGMLFRHDDIMRELVKRLGWEPENVKNLSVVEIHSVQFE